MNSNDITKKRMQDFQQKAAQLPDSILSPGLLSRIKSTSKSSSHTQKLPSSHRKPQSRSSDTPRHDSQSTLKPTPSANLSFAQLMRMAKANELAAEQNLSCTKPARSNHPKSTQLLIHSSSKNTTRKTSLGSAASSLSQKTHRASDAHSDGSKQPPLGSQLSRHLSQQSTYPNTNKLPRQTMPASNISSIPSRPNTSSANSLSNSLKQSRSLVKSTSRASKSRPPPPPDLKAIQRTAPRPQDIEARFDELRQRRLHSIGSSKDHHPTASTHRNLSQPVISKNQKSLASGQTITAPPVRRIESFQSNTHAMSRSSQDHSSQPSVKRHHPKPDPHKKDSLSYDRPTKQQRHSSPPHKKPSSSAPNHYNLDEAILDSEFVAKNTSSIIQQMFRRGGSNATGSSRQYGLDSDSGSDMEVGFSTLDREEKQSARIAKREDAEEERLQQETERRLSMKRRR
ncbi:hypothetical protein QVD99_004399 [Batrachochytrium dendrobatidis]|nr:hypothetical protein O5D80_002464 [Batrachochytrium dendrobatidis]KAK5668605.1 hypothetical protein QVD99_004399 [Batrachochytrium dendrobatidis]